MDSSQQERERECRVGKERTGHKSRIPVQTHQAQLPCVQPVEREGWADHIELTEIST